MAERDITWGRLLFEQAIAFLNGKTNQDTDHWRDVVDEQHDVKFVVAGAKGDLLMDFREAIQEVILGNLTVEEFQTRFDDIVARHGWSYTGSRDWRSRLIAKTNTLAAYGAGRYSQQFDPEVRQLQPFAKWVHGDSRDPRPHHLALNGRVFSLSDPFFPQNYPPNGWGCLCRIVTLSLRQLRREGLTVERAPIDGTVETFRLPNGKTKRIQWGPDPGFVGAPGATRVQELRRAGLKNFPDELKEAVEREAPPRE